MSSYLSKSVRKEDEWMNVNDCPVEVEIRFSIIFQPHESHTQSEIIQNAVTQAREQLMTAIANNEGIIDR